MDEMDTNTYKVFYDALSDTGEILTICQFEYDYERFLCEIEKALKSSLSLTVTDGLYDNDKGGIEYLVTIHFGLQHDWATLVAFAQANERG